MKSMRMKRAKTLAMLLMSACGSTGGGASGGPGGGGGAGDVGSMPAALVGSWYAGAGGVSAPYDPGTGTWGRPAGQGLVFVFNADGSYTKAFQSYNSAGGCTNGFTAFESGAAGGSDDGQLRMVPRSGHVKVEDSCAPSLDSDKPTTGLEAQSLTFRLVDGDLELSDEYRNSSRFRRL